MFFELPSDLLDSEHLWALPAGLAAFARKIHPVVFPITGNPREERAMRRHTLVSAEHDPAAINQDDFAHGLFRADSTCAWVIKVKKLARERQLDEVFLRDGLRLIEHRKDFKAGVHAVNDFGFDRQPAPDIFTNVGRFILEHLS